MVKVQHPSPNFTPPSHYGLSEPRAIKLVVIHATATPGLDSPLEWLCDPNSKASAHYLIGRDGVVYQLVQDTMVSWHAGISEWKGLEWKNPKTGVTSVNPISVGIELVNSNDGAQDYPAEQKSSAAQVVADICKEHGLSTQCVVGHLDVAPGRKNDPVKFPWVEFIASLRAMGVKEA